MRRRWRLRPCPSDAAPRLAADLGISPRLASLLAGRGLCDATAAGAFLEARLAQHLRSPMLFRQMPAAVERLATALARQQKIGIHGDYDVDGMSGSAILVRFLRALGHEPVLFIPNRMRDGYGLKESGIRTLAAAGVDLMITVDCGGCSHQEIALARTLGMDTIVCDHHQVSGRPLPAVAVLNPIEPDAGFPFAGLCGAGVAFYLALGARMHLRAQGHERLPDLRRSLDLVTLGTIADVVPLVEENRVLVKYGLRELMQTGLPGIVALKQVSGVTAVSTGAVGFRLAPRLNAGGRLADASRGVELLTTDDPLRAQQLAAELDDENRARQAIEREILADALGRIERDRDGSQRRSIVLASRDWHPGVVGIVAARLVERFHRPAVVIAIDPELGIGRGSGRSIAKLDLHAAFTQCGDLLAGFGGHRMAAGLTIAEDRVAAFAERFEAAVRGLVAESAFTPETLVDAELALDQLSPALASELDRLEPFGAGNPEPVFLARNVEVAAARVVGETYLKLLLRQGGRRIAAIAFGMADSGLEAAGRVDLLYSLQRNEWNGSVALEARVRDWRKAQETS